MLKKLGIFLATSLSLLAIVHARDLGVQGTTFEIKEQSLLEVIYTRLRDLESTNKLAGHQKEIQTRVRNSIENPLPVAGIKAAISYAARTYDPSIIIDEDIKDHKGSIIARKGTHINPLDYHSFGKPLLFIKGDDPAQVEWALKQDAKDTSVTDTSVTDTSAADTRVAIVLVSGRPLHLTKTYNKAFFFDQGGALSKRFSITTVPARISQKDKTLLIEEFNLEGGK